MKVLLILAILCSAMGCSAGNEQDSTKDEPPATTTADPVDRPTYTVKEYEIYRAVVDSSASTENEDTAVGAVASKYGITANEVRAATEKVAGVLAENNWFGSRDSERRKASDYAGQ